VDHEESDSVEPDSRVPWRKELQSVLRGRGRPDALPEDFESAIEKASQELQAAGRALVQTSVQALLDQIEAVKASGATRVLEERRRRLAERLDESHAEWSRNLQKALGSLEDDHQTGSDAVVDGATNSSVRRRDQGTHRSATSSAHGRRDTRRESRSSGLEQSGLRGDRIDPDVLYREIRERLDADLAKTGLPREVSLPRGFSMWSTFARIEVAIGALATISALRTETEVNVQPPKT